MGSCACTANRRVAAGAQVGFRLVNGDCSSKRDVCDNHVCFQVPRAATPCARQHSVGFSTGFVASRLRKQRSPTMRHRSRLRFDPVWAPHCLPLLTKMVS